jgi:photosystem II stability/assembly factor-like uncharacterized protein
MATIRTLAVFAFVALAAARAAAQSGDDAGWTTAGPESGNVAVLAAAPANALRLFAGTELGVFRSDDGGATWPAVPAGPLNVVALALDPTNSDHVWAVTDAGVALSTDGGATFGSRSTMGGLSTIAIDPVDPRVVYTSGEGGDVSRSSDGGASWESYGTSANVRRIAELIIDPGNSNHLLAAAADAEFTYFDYVRPEILASSDAGKTWTTLLGRSGGGLPYKLSTESISLAFDPRGNGTLYAGVANQVYRSADGGASWRTSPFLSLGSVVSSLAVDPHTPETLFAGTDRGAFRSTDAGVHWELLRGPTDFSVNALAFDAERGVLHAATSNGVWERAVTAPIPSVPCQAASGSLCLLGGRFSARVDGWDPRTGTYTAGTAVSQTDGFGYFSFPAFTGDPSLPEVLVKMVDAAAPPWNSDWVFWGSLTDVDFLLTVTDTVTGLARTYENNPLDPFCGGADITAFSPGGSGGSTVAQPTHPKGSGDTLSLLGGRIEVQITASDPRTGAAIAGTAIARDDRFGYFSLPSLTGDSGLPEVIVKAIDATSLTGTLWFFYGGMTSLPYNLTIRNTATGEVLNSASPGSFCGGSYTGIAASAPASDGVASDRGASPPLAASKSRRSS